MKASLLIKLGFVLPLILLVDYIIIAAIGCTSCLLGMGDAFFCGAFCVIGKIVLILSALIFSYLIYPEMLYLYKLIKHGSPAEK